MATETPQDMLSRVHSMAAHPIIGRWCFCRCCCSDPGRTPQARADCTCKEYLLEIIQEVEEANARLHDVWHVLRHGGAHAAPGNSPLAETPPEMIARARSMAAGPDLGLNEKEQAALRFVLALADDACDAAQERLRTPERFTAYLDATARAARGET